MAFSTISFPTIPGEDAPLGRLGAGLGEGSAPAPTRPKRKQVSRACDWCRVHRVKCDASFPCRNCQARGAECSNKGEVRSLPQAMRVIEQLRVRVKELEAEVERAKPKPTGRFADRGDGNPVSVPGPMYPDTPTSSSPGSPDTVVPATRVSAAPEPDQDSFDRSTTPRKPWQGVYSRGARSQQTSYYGPSSSFYFLTRISAFLGNELQQPHPDHEMQPLSASGSYANPNGPEGDDGNEETRPSVGGRTSDIPERFTLSRVQEQYFLSLFWQFYYRTLPIIDEADFRSHYQSLWASRETTRKQSPLVDIILALCMQYGYAFLFPSNNSGSTVDRDDSTIAGRFFYRRSQALLASELESPSIRTLQCHIFTAVYLCCASFQNMGNNTCALAVRTAQILGLHLEPPEQMPTQERELRKRIWWILATIESKMSMKLGRPFAFEKIQVTCSMPSDDFEAATQPGSTIEAYGSDVTWLTYVLQCNKLIDVSRDIYESLYHEIAKLLSDRDLSSPYDDPDTLELAARHLNSKMELLHGWALAVPQGIKTARRNGGEPFSLDRSPISVEHHAPLWLKRQRLCLELIYHTMAMNLYRPFIWFSHQKHYGCCPTSGDFSTNCINHAVAHTFIMHQAVTETDLLNGWHEAFQWQWNATVTIIGFLLAYPVNPAGPSARRALDKAVEAFEAFGSNNVAVARNAAVVTRNLTAKADLLIARFRTGFTGNAVPFWGTADSVNASGMGRGEPGAVGGDDKDTPMQGADGQAQDFGCHTMPTSISMDAEQPLFSDFMDLATTVDYFNNFEDFLNETTDR